MNGADILHTESFFKKPLNIFLIAALCTLLWGSAFPGVKLGYELLRIATDDLPSKILFAGCRFGLAGVFTLIFAVVSGRRWVYPTRKNIGGITLIGLIQTSLQYIFFYIGLSYTTGVKGSILSATSTFMIVILAHFVYRDDKITLQKAIGCLLGFCGVILVNLGGGLEGFSFLGEGCVLLSALAFALGSLVSKNVASKGEPATITAYQLMIGGAALIAIGLLCGGRITIPTWEALALFLYLALLSSVAFVLWATLLRYNPVGKISVFNFLTPVFGSVLSVIFLPDQGFSINILFALALACAGIILVNREKSGRKKTES
ncbi:MAG: DMT family transporter [Oscillospiraceae bacterium]|nr:DMT family transporter [Oscillospiraceae bacterium]